MPYIPRQLRYTQEHEYVKSTDEPDVYQIGITDFAPGELGDIVYVALLDQETRMIDFPYRLERGKPAPRPPLALGEGLTSQILASRQPLLLNRAEQFEVMERQGVGTSVKSYLGVPIPGPA